MTYLYELGAMRWKKYTGNGDVRTTRSPAGWETFAALLDYNPITGRQLKRSCWWIRETFTGV